jgi:hypothetical protein
MTTPTQAKTDADAVAYYATGEEIVPFTSDSNHPDGAASQDKNFGLKAENLSFGKIPIWGGAKLATIAPTATPVAGIDSNVMFPPTVAGRRIELDIKKAITHDWGTTSVAAGDSVTAVFSGPDMAGAVAGSPVTMGYVAAGSATNGFILTAYGSATNELTLVMTNVTQAAQNLPGSLDYTAVIHPVSGSINISQMKQGSYFNSINDFWFTMPFIMDRESGTDMTTLRFEHSDYTDTAVTHFNVAVWNGKTGALIESAEIVPSALTITHHKFTGPFPKYILIGIQ